MFLASLCVHFEALTLTGDRTNVRKEDRDMMKSKELWQTKLTSQVT